MAQSQMGQAPPMGHVVAMEPVAQVELGVPGAPTALYPPTTAPMAPMASASGPGPVFPRKFDPQTGVPLPKFDPMTGVQNW